MNIRFIAKSEGGKKYISNLFFSWMHIPTDEKLKSVKVQGPNGSWEYTFKNAAGYYFMKEAIAKLGGFEDTAVIVGVIDKKEGKVDEWYIERGGRISRNQFPSSKLIELGKEDKFNLSIIREGIT